MKWLFVASDPWPMHHGTALRVFHLARELSSAGDSVTLLTDWQGKGAREAYEAIGASYKQVPASREGTACKKNTLYQVNSSFTVELEKGKGDHDVVVLFAAEMLQHAKVCCGYPQIVADLIDDPVLAALRRLRRPSSFRWALRNLRLLWDLRRYEMRYRAAVDLFTFVTDVDAGSFRRRNRSCRVAAIANGVPLDGWAGPAQSAEPYLLFVGNLSFVPNRTAVEHLVWNVAPLVWQQCPDVRFRLVGGNPPPWLVDHPDPRLAATGFVDDVRPHICGARGVIIPMVTGTGIKNKLLEAWAAAKAVVATPLACQGVPVRQGENILLGRSARELAAAIVSVWQDAELAERLATAGRAVVVREFSWPLMAAGLRRAVSGLAGGGR
jgi:glycosyltransferase involved in cell wall biosynthesis